MTEPIQWDMRPSLTCRKCSGNKLIVPDHSTDDSLVTCAGCGAEIGRWGDVRVGILETAEDEGAKHARASHTMTHKAT